MGDLGIGIAVGLGASGSVVALVWLFRRYKAVQCMRASELAKQYQVMMAFGSTELPKEILDSPALSLSRQHFRQIDAIEGELVHASDKEVAMRLLKSYLMGSDPWVAARAAWALDRWDSAAALARLRTLLSDPSPFVQLPAIWALGQLGTPMAVNLLIESVSHDYAETQRAALRSLVQVSSRNQLPTETLSKIEKLFSDTRAKAGWVL